MLTPEGKEAGFALFFHNFSTFLGRAGIYLEDLYVRPEYRGRGYGKGLTAAWLPWQWNGAADGWSGGAWTGTSPASISISRWEQSPCPTGLSIASPARLSPTSPPSLRHRECPSCSRGC